MTNKEKLIELLHQASYGAYKHTLEDTHTNKAIEDIADYLLSNGVIVPRCKVGDLVYCINRRNKRIFHSYIKYITITNKGLSYVTYWDSAYHDEDFGEVIFLSEEDAKKALKEEVSRPA